MHCIHINTIVAGEVMIRYRVDVCVYVKHNFLIYFVGCFFRCMCRGVKTMYISMLVRRSSSSNLFETGVGKNVCSAQLVMKIALHHNKVAEVMSFQYVCIVSEGTVSVR